MSSQVAIHSLPEPVFFFTLSFLSQKDIAACAQVCKLWNRIMLKDDLWKQLQESWQLPYINVKNSYREQMIAQMKASIYVKNRKAFLETILDKLKTAQINQITAFISPIKDKKEYVFFYLYDSNENTINFNPQVADSKKIEELFLNSTKKYFIFMKENDVSSSSEITHTFCADKFSDSKNFASKKIFCRLRFNNQLRKSYEHFNNEMYQMVFKTNDYPYNMRPRKKIKCE